MHILRHFPPGDDITRSVGAEHGISGPVRIPLRLIGDPVQNLLLVVAGMISGRVHGNFSEPVGVRQKCLGIIAELADKNFPAQDAESIFLPGAVQLCVHGAEVGNGASELLIRQFQFKMIDRLQQTAFRLHQPVTKRPSGRLPKVAALGMFRMCPAADEANACIGQFRPAQDARKDFMAQGIQNQILPIAVQDILGTTRLQLDPASRRQRFQNQVHLGIVPQGFKVADAFHPACDGFLINQMPLFRTGPKAEAFQKQSPEHLPLHSAGKAHTDPVPAGLRRELRQLFAELLQLLQQDHRILSAFKAKEISPDRFGILLPDFSLFTEKTACSGSAESEKAAHLACLYAFDRFIAHAGIDSDSGDFLLFQSSSGTSILHRVPDGKPATGNFHLGQTRSPCIPADLIAQRGKACRPLGSPRPAVQPVQELLHARLLQARAEEAGKNPSGSNRLGKNVVRDLSAIQPGIQASLFLFRGLLKDAFQRSGEIDNAVGKLFFQLPQKLLPVTAGEVHLGHKDPGGDLPGAQQFPDHAGVSLDAFAAADYQDRRIRHAQATSGLGKEVRMARCIDQAEFCSAVREDRLFGKRGDSAASFKFLIVQGRVPMIHSAPLFQLSRLIEHRFSQRCFSRVDMCRDAQGNSLSLIHAVDSIRFLHSMQARKVFSTVFLFSETLTTIFERTML